MSSSSKTAVFCADVEVAEHEGEVAVVKDVMLEIGVVDAVVVALLMSRRSHVELGC